MEANGFLCLTTESCSSAGANRFCSRAATTADLGGIDRLSTAQQQLVRRLAGLSIICEGIEVELAQGQRPSGESLQEYIAAINAARRVSHSIGLERVPRDITPAALESYFAQQYDAASEAAE
jgi:hypothetical protein